MLSQLYWNALLSAILLIWTDMALCGLRAVGWCVFGFPGAAIHNEHPPSSLHILGCGGLGGRSHCTSVSHTLHCACDVLACVCYSSLADMRGVTSAACQAVSPNMSRQHDAGGDHWSCWTWVCSLLWFAAFVSAHYVQFTTSVPRALLPVSPRFIKVTYQQAFKYSVLNLEVRP